MIEHSIQPNQEYDGRDLEVLADVPNYYNWIMETFRPYLGGNALEIGAGIGTFSKNLLPHVSRLDLLEPSQNLNAQLQDTFKNNPNVTVSDQSLENFLDRSSQLYDVIVMVNVLEHIEDDGAALQGLKQRLRPDGYLLLYVPALPFLYSRFDQIYGHFRRYTRHNLRQTLETAGFRIEGLHYMDVLSILPWYVLNTLGGQAKLNPSAVSLYDNIGVPATKFIEKLFPFPFGKNLIAVTQSQP
ncbi:MAG: class I SAM-dependent methyltransferase [Rhodospirillales bacterium]